MNGAQCSQIPRNSFQDQLTMEPLYNPEASIWNVPSKRSFFHQWATRQPRIFIRHALSAPDLIAAIKIHCAAKGRKLLLCPWNMFLTHENGLVAVISISRTRVSLFFSLHVLTIFVNWQHWFAAYTRTHEIKSLISIEVDRLILNRFFILDSN